MGEALLWQLYLSGRATAGHNHLSLVQFPAIASFVFSLFIMFHGLSDFVPKQPDPAS